MIITEGSGSGKPNELLDLVKLKDDDDHDVIDKIFYMLRIRIKKIINILLENVKPLSLITIKIQMLSLKIQKIYRMSTKILMSTI